MQDHPELGARASDAFGQVTLAAVLLRLRTRTAVGHHLLDAFVDAAYRPHPRRPSRWSADRAGPALRFLARYMERGRDGTAELAWWKLRHAVPTALPLMLAGVLLGMVAWSFEGIGMELTHHFTPDGAPVRWDQRGGLGVVAAGICGGLVCGLAAGLAAMTRCALVAAPDVTAELVLNRLADAATLTLAGVIISGFAFGGRPHLRRPADWDRRALVTALVPPSATRRPSATAAAQFMPSCTVWPQPRSARTACAPIFPVRPSGCAGTSVCEASAADSRSAC
ncbi:hypothetical protein [Streptomyces sp. BPTC-684]|uniref:hypothetical protein n=1 Tax=Streptomyces sp. BPTC-684 TaxID=3043734 RepID=UPI0024B13065|nr:hypothetical protein [Streptomyces sp. BPTC-684]WHM40966.1 hypothetical protein QIY60_31570 [Streptomyces sp. BPTC-684]